MCRSFFAAQNITLRRPVGFEPLLSLWCHRWNIAEVAVGRPGIVTAFRAGGLVELGRGVAGPQPVEVVLVVRAGVFIRNWVRFVYVITGHLARHSSHILRHGTLDQQEHGNGGKSKCPYSVPRESRQTVTVCHVSFLISGLGNWADSRLERRPDR